MTGAEILAQARRWILHPRGLVAGEVISRRDEPPRAIR